jgi:carotenoid cleavage dioxygenase-like enzyme
MATPFPADHPYLNKGFEPIRVEYDYADLVVEGTIPRELNGSLYRIGPNPQFAPRGPYNPLLADGMIHAFHIRDGRVAYRNRWVRTQQWQREHTAGRSLFGTTGSPRDADPEVAGLQTDGVANTGLIWHGQRLLALEEGHAPIQIDPITLETLGPWTFAGALPGNMTAHPKVDPGTGEMFFFANFPNKDFSGALAFYIASAAGRLTRSEIIQGPFPSLVHDFAITADYILFFVCPVTLSMERIRKGASPIGWEPERGTHIGIFPRGGSTSDIRWFKAPSCMAWHSMNAFQNGEDINLDVCAQAAPAFPNDKGKAPSDTDLRQYLTRWTMDWSSPSSVVTTRLNGSVCEYPKIDDRRVGIPHRFGFVACAGGPGTGDLFHRAVGRYELETGQLRSFHFGGSSAISEAIFAPKSPGSAEGDGYLLLTVFDERRNASYLAIVDAMHIEAGPIATAHLDHRVPLGFHGVWRAATVPPHFTAHPSAAILPWRPQ